MNIIVIILVFIVFTCLVIYSSEIINEKLDYDDKIKNNLIIGLISMCIAYFSAKQIKNKKMKDVSYGLYLSAIFLFIYSVLYNWSDIDNKIKLLLLTISFGIILKYANK